MHMHRASFVLHVHQAKFVMHVHQAKFSNDKQDADKGQQQPKTIMIIKHKALAVHGEHWSRVAVALGKCQLGANFYAEGSVSVCVTLSGAHAWCLKLLVIYYAICHAISTSEIQRSLHHALSNARCQGVNDAYLAGYDDGGSLMLHRCDATMASMTDSDKAISFTSPPQLRVVGFTTSSATSEEASENCSTTSHSLQESPLSRLLRSATWPTLRVRLCKTEIPAGLSGGSQCSVHTIHCEQDDSVTPHGRSSSPISIPREYRYVFAPFAADHKHFEY